MKLRPRKRPDDRRRGAALLLSFVVLIVLITIVFQISIGTMTDARIGRNDVGLTQMDNAISSARYDIFELLKGDADAAAEGGGGEGGAEAAMATAAAGGEGGAEEEPPADSRKDEWAMPQRTEINGIQLRILVEAENAKYNVLNMLTEDEEEAEEAFMRVVRIIDLYREGTEDDISERDAEDMALAMKEHMLERQRSDWEKPILLTEDEEREGVVMPMSLRDFLVLEPFYDYQFRSYRDPKDVRVHSLDQFLTVWSSPGMRSDLPNQGDEAAGSSRTSPAPSDAASDDASGGEGEGGAEGDEADAGAGTGVGGDQEGDGTTPLGYGVNVNLAPGAVLKGLFDERDIRYRFWDEVIEYRNLEEEEDDSTSDESIEPIYDEFGEEIIERRAIESLEELEEVRSWEDLDSEQQEKVRSLLETTSEVFTIYLTARRTTSNDAGYGYGMTPEEQAREEENPSGTLVRTVRIVVWRRSGDEGAEIVPIVPWEILDFSPYELEDYPEEW